MPPKQTIHLTREEQAMREAGTTKIRKSTALTLILIFLAIICAGPLMQHMHDRRAYQSGARASAWPQSYDFIHSMPDLKRAFVQAPGGLPQRIFAVNRLLLHKIQTFENTLEDESAIGKLIRPQIQYMLAAWLGAGNEKVYCGQAGWLFYRPDLDYLTGAGFLNPKQLARRRKDVSEWVATPQPDPRQAILSFDRYLRKQGITLILLPTPSKPAIQPDKFSGRTASATLPLENSSYQEMLKGLRRDGVLIHDPSTAILQGNSSDAYLATDTHWRPESITRAAHSLALFINTHVHLPPRPHAAYQSLRVTATNRGDLAAMLQLPPGTSVFAPENVQLRQIETRRGEFWQADEKAEILVLGDSFCNIYSLAAMNWGESAGFVEQLSFELQRPLDRIVINDNAAYATRAILARELARGHNRLAGKRIVIWQFATRELAHGDWKAIDMRAGAPQKMPFFVPAPGKALNVRAVVRSISPAPRPGSVPYQDHITAIHLIELESSDTAPNGVQALVYVYSMRDNIRTRFARLRPGDTTIMRLRPWSDVTALYEGINRSEPADEALQLVEPCWGEEPDQNPQPK